jgi:MFS superfamily sulfate permease-like transporter
MHAKFKLTSKASHPHVLCVSVAALSSDPAERLGYVLVITFFVGLLCLLFGLLRLGFIVNFISKPVLSGFASAAAIITSISVVKVLPCYIVLLWRCKRHAPFFELQS